MFRRFQLCVAMSTLPMAIVPRGSPNIWFSNEMDWTKMPFVLQKQSEVQRLFGIK